jgi:hypothetical protein
VVVIVVIRPDASPQLRDPRDFARLEVHLTGDLAISALPGVAPIGQDARPSHVWLDVETLQSWGPSDDDWVSAFHVMIERAAAAGWVNPDGTAVRAHVVAT